MIVLLSPSKTQDFETPSPVKKATLPALLDDASLLMKQLEKLKKHEIATLMEVSEKIAALNYERFHRFTLPFTASNAKPAVFAFRGDVYDGLDADTLPPKALTFAQAHLRILSGLYGALRPLDLIQPYRLEMKIRLANPRGKDLYRFWGSRITDEINAAAKASKAHAVINLASEEYFKAVQAKTLTAPLVTPQFKEKKGKDFHMVALFAKQARGRLARFIITHGLRKPEEILAFAEDGYRLNKTLSTEDKPVFTRG